MLRLLSLLLPYLAEKVLSFAFKKLLLGAGLGLVTFGITQGVYSILLNYVKDSFSMLSALFYLIDICGLDVAISYILSGISIRLTMNAGKLSLRKI
ncbi:hypothetical protein F885_03015 [Acinetobacter higginsii]|uniref:DUF2523 family protein n=1 Tax=Acinetobacter higginsii TaxID=70347 RepID=UPI0002CDF48A|nr:DUF2523 family protein [Acinetobacter higginsii]ENX56859.1 hypothetical protein F885_03015 [Acinetobacter higginsii]